MKRITRLFLTAAVVLFAGSAFAQDMTQAGELYQKATEAYQAGNEIEAVKGFKNKLKLREITGEGNGTPLQCSCLENPRDRQPGGLPSMGSQSRTRLMRLSSSSSSI